MQVEAAAQLRDAQFGFRFREAAENGDSALDRLYGSGGSFSPGRQWNQPFDVVNGLYGFVAYYETEFHKLDNYDYRPLSGLCQ